jgi:D-alanyl-D-alanine carboxypeptidase
MPIDEVVWRVNACADMFLYEDPVTITDFNAKPLVVNKFNSLPAEYVPPSLVSIPGTFMQADAETYEAFLKMQAAAAAEGVHLSVASAYRAYEYQEVLYNPTLGDMRENLRSRIARPGYSEHQSGLALDLCVSGGKMSDFEGTPEAKWLSQNAGRFGFLMRYTKDLEDITGFLYEPWHVRYLGDEIISFMEENNIRTLEEYKVKHIDHKPGDEPQKIEKNELGSEKENGPI